MDYLEADELLFELFQSDVTPMLETARETAFPKTYRAMFNFCVKTSTLKTAVFDMVESENPYALNVLFRCYCEHYLKFTYIVVRFLAEKTDTVGNEYYSFCGASELQDYANALAVEQKLVGRDISADVEAVIAKVYPDLAETPNNDIRAASDRFRYRAILRFLATKSFPSANNSFLPSIVPSYALRSSFVHGGPATEREMVTYSKPEALEKCRKDAELVFMMTASVIMLTAMAVSREFPKYGIVAGKVQALLKLLNAEEPADTREQ